MKQNSAPFQPWWIYLWKNTELFYTSPDPHLPKDTACSFVCSYQSSLCQKPGASRVLSHRTRRKLKDVLDHSASDCRKPLKTQFRLTCGLRCSNWLHNIGTVFPNPTSSDLKEHQLKIDHVFSANHFSMEAVAGVGAAMLFSCEW